MKIKQEGDGSRGKQRGANADDHLLPPRGKSSKPKIGLLSSARLGETLLLFMVESLSQTLAKRRGENRLSVDPIWLRAIF